MPDVPPEIATLHDLAFDVTEEGWESCSATSCVPLADAEAAVLACEKRMATHAAEVLHRERERTIAAITTMVRESTVAEIVAELRAIASDFGNGECDHPAVAEAADVIEQRFGAKEEEDDDAVS